MNSRTIGVAALCAIAGLASAQSGTMQSVDANPDRMVVEVELEPRTGLPVGAKVPDVQVLDQDGQAHSLGSLIAKAGGPVVVIFYRGGWCPYCTKHLAELGARADELEATGATVLAISPESFEKLGVSEEKSEWDDLESGYTLLSDPSHEAARRFNLLFDVDADTKKRYKGYGIDLGEWNADQQWSLPVPAAYVIDAGSVIRYAHVDEDYRERVDVDKLLDAVRKVGG